MIETIKEYLVSLGFGVDDASYNKANKVVESLDKGIADLATGAIKNFAKASAAIVSFGAAIATATVSVLNNLGNQEIQMEILSRQLWTTQQQAQAFSLTLKAMGTNLQNLYLSPTLMKQYQQLIGVANEMSTPGDYTAQIQQIQQIQLGFKQMRLEAYYALQWIGYYFVKYMSGPISGVNDILQKINATIVKNMPDWTKKVASVMVSFYNAGVHIVDALSSVWNWMTKLFSYIPGWAKGVGAALAFIAISNPFTLIIAGIAAFLLLLDDFETYIHGGKSAFPQLWAWLIKINGEFQKLGMVRSFISMIVTIFQTLGTMLRDAWTFAKNLWTVFQDNGTISAFVQAVEGLGNAMGALFQAIGSVVGMLGQLFGFFTNGNGTSGMILFFQTIADICIGAIDVAAGAIEMLSGLARIVVDFLEGNWNDIPKIAKQTLGSINSIMSGGNGSTGSGASSGFGASSYYPSTNSMSTMQNFTINAGQNNYITGNSPGAIANAVNMGYNRTLYNIRSVIV